MKSIRETSLDQEMFRVSCVSRQVYRSPKGTVELSIKYNHSLDHIQTLERDLANARQLLFRETAGFPMAKHQHVEVKWHIKKGREEIEERLGKQNMQLQEEIQEIEQQIVKTNRAIDDIPLLQKKLESAKEQLEMVKNRQKMCEKDLYSLNI